MSKGKKKTMAKKTKLHVTFDAEKRLEYLTGFSKRKQARRRFGIDMQAFKDRKAQLAQKKERKASEAAALEHRLRLVPQEEESEEDSDKEQQEKQQLYNDSHTTSKFGSSVSVTVSLGTPPDSEEDVVSSDEEDKLDDEKVRAKLKLKRGFSANNDMTLFQRIQFKRRGKALPTRRGKLKAVKQAQKFFGKKEGKKKSGKTPSEK